jgi:hypothetical protein
MSAILRHRNSADARPAERGDWPTGLLNTRNTLPSVAKMSRIRFAMPDVPVSLP